MEAMQEFVSRHGLEDFPHVEDDGTIFAAYGLASQPAWAFIDDDGSASTVLGGLGPDGIAQNLETLLAG